MTPEQQKTETPEVLAERIARHHLDSERVSVTQFCDIVEAIAAVIRERDNAIKTALDALQSDHVLPNLFRMGLLGKQEVEQAIETLRAIRKMVSERDAVSGKTTELTVDPIPRAVKECAKWSQECLRLGWPKSALDDLEKLWWQYHDRFGKLKERQ